MNRRCARKGHKWRPKVRYAPGEDRCARWGCAEERINPNAIHPYWW